MTHNLPSHLQSIDVMITPAFYDGKPKVVAAAVTTYRP